MRAIRIILARPDLAIIAVLIAAIAVMVIPLPTWLVDLFLALNISASVLLVMVAFYLRSAGQFTTLPALILLATLVRLSLSIAVTRLVLTQAYAGAIIQAFGHFVVGGNVVVGLVIFLIITIVQFIVIAKGSERVAEVAARFMLDALPGKQLAIDADLRSGQLDQDQARGRRQELERESHLYGAMDGAMKFVKGDAIAGLVIIIVNLLGGLGIGMLQRGLSFSDAARTYSILTVGDGLVAQIPALLIAVTAGTVVTRIAGTEADNLGAEIVTQILRDNRAVAVGGVVSCGLGLVPGFPTVVFTGIGLALLALARWRSRAKALLEAARVAQSDQEAAEAQAPIGLPSRLRLTLGTGLDAMIDTSIMQPALVRTVQDVGDQLGIALPAPDSEIDDKLDPLQFRVDLDMIPLAYGSLPAGRLLLTDDRDHALLADVTVEPCDPSGPQAGYSWVEDAARERLRSFGIGFAEIDSALMLAVTGILTDHADMFMGVQEARSLLSALEAQSPELVREAMRLVTLPRLAELFRRLLSDGLSLAPMRGILESIISTDGSESDAGAFAEQIRAALRRQICHNHADPMRVIAAFLVDPEAEVMLRAALRQTPQGTSLNLPASTIASLVERMRGELAASRGPAPVLLTTADLRRHLRMVLKASGLRIAVLAYNDILPGFTVQPLGNIRLPAAPSGARARAMASSLTDAGAAA
jgi:type III secretion protein V